MKRQEADTSKLDSLLDAVLKKYLGELEAAVLRSVWRLRNATAREILADLRYRRRPAYTTVNTVLWRLCEKGLVRRSSSGRSFRYSPAATQEEFLRNLSARLMVNLLKDFGPVAVASFVDQVRAEGPEQLDLLDRLLRGRRRR